MRSEEFFSEKVRKCECRDAPSASERFNSSTIKRFNKNIET